MAKAKAKSKPCAKAKCKGKGLGKGKGRGKGKGLGTRASLQGLARRQAVVRKRKAQVLEEIPGPTVEQDPLVAELKLELESQLLDIHVDEAGEADPAPSAEPSVDAAPSQHAVLEQSASLPPAGVVEELSEACAPESEQHGAARPLFARADGDAEEPSAVAQRATAVQAQPSIETLPDPMSGPRETGMAQPSSSSGSAPVQGPNPASSHHGEASERGPREHGPHLNSTPDFLSELDPPEDFKLRLSFNDHRFKAEIMTKEYLSRDGKKSCSHTFARVRSDWKQALAHVHRWAWTEWQAAKPERQFPANCQPGVIPEAYLERLAPIIDALPRPTKYAK